MHEVVEKSVWHSCQACVWIQTLPEDSDGSARDGLAADQSASADIPPCAEWIIKNRTDPSWRNKTLLLLLLLGAEEEQILY